MYLMMETGCSLPFASLRASNLDSSRCPTRAPQPSRLKARVGVKTGKNQSILPPIRWLTGLGVDSPLSLRAFETEKGMCLLVRSRDRTAVFYFNPWRLYRAHPASNAAVTYRTAPWCGFRWVARLVESVGVVFCAHHRALLPARGLWVGLAKSGRFVCCGLAQVLLAQVLLAQALLQRARRTCTVSTSVYWWRLVRRKKSL